MTENARPTRSTNTEHLIRQVRKGGIILLILFALSAVGIGITDFAPGKALWYWLAMGPVFGGLCIYLEWARHTDPQSVSPLRIVSKQVFHWVGFLFSVYLVFLLHSTGRLNDANSGLVALLTLAMATFFAGLHCDWRVCLVGIVLGSTVVGAALLEEFLWMLLIPLVAAVVVGLVWWRHRAQSSEEL